MVEFEALCRAGAIEDLDYHFARLMVRLAGDTASDGLQLGALLASRSTGAGHVCIDLGAVAGTAVIESPGLPPLVAPPLAGWLAELRNSRVVGAPGERAPLVLDSAGRCYLYRYWDYEQRLAEQLRARAVDDVPVDLARLCAGLARLFPGGGDPRVDWQQVAAAVAVLKRFCVVSGGPGTGKTSTVARLLALLVEQVESPNALRIALAAPTGKAAARLQQALQAARAALDVDAATRAAIPETAATVHRLLAISPRDGTPRFGPERRLPLDVLVVDEASMVDLALMTRLVEALPPACRLVLLGDRDQLASVEAGAVLGDLCDGAGDFSTAFAARLAAVTGVPPGARATGDGPVADSIVLLRHSYRFGSDSGIGRLAAAVNRGDAAATQALLEEAASDDTRWLAVTDDTAFDQAILAVVIEGYGAHVEAVAAGLDPAELLARFERFRVLCAHRAGRRGAEQINRVVDAWARRSLGVPGGAAWYAGQPLMVTRNDPVTRLFNGDIGLMAVDGEGRLQACFAGQQGGLRRFSPGRLPDHQPVYAMTVHKSQGSEFDRVALVLPELHSAVCTRELLYTAVTRARSEVDVIGSAAVLAATVRQRLHRHSGLRDRLREGWELEKKS